MKHLFTILFLLILSPAAFSQHVVKGDVKNNKGEIVANASVYIVGTTSVVTTGTDGTFTLTTTRTGPQKIAATALGMPKVMKDIEIRDSVTIVSITLVDEVKQLDEFVITAGNMSASNDRAIAVLDPIDIVTTAGGQGDIVGAIQTLPGVQRNGGDQTGLMVRGGDVNESSIIIDATTSQNAFNSTVPGVAQRSRFNPFQFKGTSFSTGGYSARFGQALSAILELSTNDLPEKNNVNFGVNFSGAYVAGDKLMDKNAIEYSGYYNNMAPYFAIANTNLNFFKVPQGGGITTRFISKTAGNGLFKMGLSHTFNKSGIEIINPANPVQHSRFELANENTFLTTSFKNYINTKWSWNTAMSFSNNTDNITWDSIAMYRNDSRVQGRAEISYKAGNKFSMFAGTEIQTYQYTQRYDTLIGQFAEFLTAGYAEAEYKPARWFALKPGVRTEYSKLLAQGNIAPRLAMAARTGEGSQIAAAGGIFYQNAPVNYLIFGFRPKFQEAIHYMLNYQYMKNNRTFRVEGYYKSYSQLVREKGIVYNPNSYRTQYGMVDNSGYGYAQGIDFFWRDKKSIKNFDYWISYSYIDTKRIYQNYTDKVTPDYVSKNNLNVVAKYFWDKLQTMVSATYSYASGRHYYDPNSLRFMADKAPDYHNLAITLSYLTNVKGMFTVIYLSVDNVTNQHNILGYRYSLDGTQAYAIKPAIYRSFFLGVNFSLTEFNKDEL